MPDNIENEELSFERFWEDPPEVRSNSINTDQVLPGDGIASQISMIGATEISRITEADIRTVMNDMVNIRSSYISHKEKISFIEHNPDDEVSLVKGGKAKYKDCVYIYDGYYLLTDNDITTDYFRPDVHILKRKANYIYLEFDDKGFINSTKPSYYYSFEGNNLNIVEIVDINTHCNTLYDKIPQQFYIENISNNIFYHKEIAPSDCQEKKLKVRARRHQGIYKPSTDRSNLLKDYKMGVLSPSFIKTEGKRFTFGLEMETISGILPSYVDSELNYMSVRDGSLRDGDGNEYGYEYVTGVLTGDTGLLQLKKLCNVLTKRCLVNKLCGVHIHMAGIEFNSENIVYLYKLSLAIEDEIMTMMPPSRRNNEYCRRLPNVKMKFNEETFYNPLEYKASIESYYNEIHKIISATNELPSHLMHKKAQHPLGPKCGYNHSTARYCWMNFVPTLFDTRENGKRTIENRLMQGSTNFTKIKNWVLINLGILWFVENHKKTIALNDKISLKYIMELAYPKSHMKINDFIDKRISRFNTSESSLNKQAELDDYKEIVDSEDLTIKNL